MALAITATAGGVTANGIAISVRTLQGAAGAVLQAGATQTQSGAAAHEASITTTTQSARCFMAAVDFANTAFTVDANSTGINDFADATNTRRYWTGRQSTSVGTPGATTLGCTAPADNGGLAIAEILPAVAGTATTDIATNPGGASALGATTVTTAGFAPASGGLIIAMVAANGGAGVVTMSVTDSAGLTWTELVKSNASGAGYAGVWVADAPDYHAGAARPGQTWRRAFHHPQLLPPAAVSAVTPVALADAGAADDSGFTVAATVPLAESGAGSDSLTVAAAVPLADTGTGADTLAVSAAVPLAETGTGADTLAVAAAVPLADAGTGADSLTAAATVPLAESGTGTDTLSVNAGGTPALAEAGSAAETLSVLVTLALAEAGSALDALTAGPPATNATSAATVTAQDVSLATVSGAVRGDSVTAQTVSAAGATDPRDGAAQVTAPSTSTSAVSDG